MPNTFMWIFMIMIAWTVGFATAGSCRAAKLCCQGRDSGCVIQKASPNAIIESPRDTPCYCDHACLKLNDCCDDFKDACNGGRKELSLFMGRVNGEDRVERDVALVSPVMRPSPSQNSIRKVTPGHCAIFTILWVSKTCSREYAPLIEGSHACVVCREDGSKTKCHNKGSTHDFAGIGRWKLSTTSYENCHGKWIGGSNMHTSCDSALCQDDLFFTFI
ncbi:uncharacterized protein LOC117170013 [Belonocnema kinseyi]|uniref:uncharacterized protein LOC117170013 n=1 Tax=Belonocnema kinseyi TaxID=2817044 RepID=UPI00143D22A5|nr:uncharacterized protein LOC117170013 [Belonocnema kinseyi]